MTHSHHYCRELCCSEYGDEILKSLYSIKGLSAYKIADMCRSSHQHIWLRLKEVGVKMRSIRDYPSKGRSQKRSVLWKIKDEELFGKDINCLMEKYGMSRRSLYQHRWRRKREDESSSTDG